MQNSKVSFKSNIRFTNAWEFNRAIKNFKSSVDEPWTAKEIVRAPNVFTTKIKSCTAGGIVVGKDNGSAVDVVMFHINPDAKQNSNFNVIKQAILDKVGDDKPVQGLLLGGKSIFSESTEMFEKFSNFMKELKIPNSKFGGISLGGHSADIAYNAKNDEWIVSATAIQGTGRTFSPKRALQKEIFNNFDKVLISHKDELLV